jgi:hypothetical protein
MAARSRSAAKPEAARPEAAAEPPPDPAAEAERLALADECQLVKNMIQQEVRGQAAKRGRTVGPAGSRRPGRAVPCATQPAPTRGT